MARQREPYIDGIPASWHASLEACGKPSQAALERAGADHLQADEVGYVGRDGHTRSGGFEIRI